jgi:hypothetical protein
MTKSKIIKVIGIVALLGIIGSAVWYLQLSNRHKAIVKTTFLFKTGLVDSNWNIKNDNHQYKMVSPTFIIDGIYKSMEGPKDSKYIQLSQDSTLLWMTSFNIRAINAKNQEQISNDFICHMNVDLNDVNYYSNFGLEERIGKQYPRLISLSHGLENFSFPKGYGVPIKGNDLLFVTTETLNHNIKDINLPVKHEVSINYSNSKNLKPLHSKTVYIQLPYDQSNPYKSPTDPGKGYCIPVETKNHNYLDKNGVSYSGHWIIPIGKKTYRSDINDMLELKDSTRLHAAAIHVHPFATAITLFDKTTQKALFTSKIINHNKLIGIESIESFSSEEGIWMYPNHEYELILETNNTSTLQQDMMGSMFLFFYDAELDKIITSRSVSE